MELEHLLSVRQVAAYLGCHENYVYGLISTGTLPAFKMGGRNRITQEDVEQYLAMRKLA